MTFSTQIFQWKCHPEAEALCLKFLEDACRSNSALASLQQNLLKQTSTRLFDWIDHLVIGHSDELEKALLTSGFAFESTTSEYRVFNHPGAQLPRIVMQDIALLDQHHQVAGVAVTVEAIADFLMVHGLSGWIEGSPFSPFRRCGFTTENGVTFWLIERRATGTMEPTYYDSSFLERLFEAQELWQTRIRAPLEEEDALMKHTIAMASELVSLIGQDLAAWEVLHCERRYWQSKNHAGQVQKARQDRLGMGWANHDHHTFRSSRRHFPQLVRLFEVLGFHCRERFWAGAEAGWGAQVMENPRCKLVLFLDVDLLPHEVEIDFAHNQLPESDTLGTVGLWCALHGDSILRSGMHHLEAQFLFEELTTDLSHQGVHMMNPFSDFPYLKQAFTSAEIWMVDSQRIEELLHKKRITDAQANKFKTEGAVGSHMENLQRREGYKGFNQKNVSSIIEKTDPRRN
ncbi:MAG: hypothetical protein H0T62_06410 [Parachlamydiaceae bacterium]|nr:hypothetical protein [Parachlamydiaceae bacterium]